MLLQPTPPPRRLLPLLLALLLSLAARPHAAEPKLQGTIVPDGDPKRGVVAEGGALPRPRPLSPADAPHHPSGRLVAGGSAWFALDAKARVGYMIETEIGGEYHKPPRGVEMLEDTVMRLYDTDRTTLLEENDDELVSKESLINWVCPRAGRYFLEVTAHAPEEGGWFHIYADTMPAHHQEV